MGVVNPATPGRRREGDNGTTPGTVGDGLVPSRRNGLRRTDTGDHKGRPYDLFSAGEVPERRVAVSDAL